MPEEAKLQYILAETIIDNELERQIGNFSRDLLITQILDALPVMIAILNVAREAVFINRAFLDFIEQRARRDALGYSPCNLLQCTNLANLESGVPNQFCRYCGIDRMLWKAQQGYSRTIECQVISDLTNPPQVMDLHVQASPLEYYSEFFVFLSIVDLSDEKRGEILERTFFHDIMNTAGSLLGAVEMLGNAPAALRPRLENIIDVSSHRLIDEITSQRELRAAERNELTAYPRPLQTLGFLEDLAGMYANHEVAKGRKIEIDEEAIDALMVIDLTLLSRVMENLLKNALEASEPGQTVRLGCDQLDERIVFWVHNVPAIPEEVQVQLFLRPFSTKGKRRGVGLYSARLLTERYLHGEITFTSSEDEGTVFKVTCPQAPPL